MQTLREFSGHVAQEEGSSSPREFIASHMQFSLESHDVGIIENDFIHKLEEVDRTENR